MRQADTINMAAQETALEDEEIDSDEKCVGENDLEKLRDAHFKAGVREGITAGTQATLQDGFNRGYQEAFHKSYNFGRVRGMLSGLLSFVSLENTRKNVDNEKYKDSINKLVSELDDIEEHHWKVTSDTTRASMTHNESTVCKTSLTTSADSPVKQLSTVNDSPEFKELLRQCRLLCDKLGVDLEIARISS